MVQAVFYVNRLPKETFAINDQKLTHDILLVYWLSFVAISPHLTAVAHVEIIEL